MSRTIEGYKLPKPLIPWMEYFEKHELYEDDDWRHYEGEPKDRLIKDANKKRTTLSMDSLLRAHIKAFKDRFRYIEKEYFEELLTSLRKIYKRPGSTDVDIEDPKEYFKLMKEMSGRIDKDDSSSDDEPVKKKGEGIKRGPGRPKKIIMKSYSSSSDEESEKMGMGLKVRRGRPTTKGGHKKCSCGSGLDVEPYQKFFQALKANTTLK